MASDKVESTNNALAGTDHRDSGQKWSQPSLLLFR